MDLIVTHNNADFDCLSSLVAARKIYPGSRLLMPGSQQRSVRELLSLVKDKIKVENEKTCDFRGINRLIVLDTRHKSRIGLAAKLADDPSVEVHIYDHHPRTPYDIKAEKDVFLEVGATVSILTDIIRRKKNIKITPLEATMMLIGVYEETGSLTYRTTTKLDVDTVSYLLSKGANLQAVSSYVNRKLSEEELAFLTKLIASTKVLCINGINVAFSKGEIEGFIGELGAIVRKLQEIENFPVLFVFFKIRDKIRVMARSRIKEIDVNKILKKFGGGGHKSAASAKLEGDIEKLENGLVRSLKSSIKVKIFAKDIMTSPVVTLSADKNVTEAQKFLNKYKLKGAPVVENARVIGVITLNDIRKATKGGYDRASVKGYMARPPVTVNPDTPLHLLQQIMFENDIGRIPVVKNAKLKGIITRSDVLRSVHRDIFKPGSTSRKKEIKFSMSPAMKRALPPGLMQMLYIIAKCADREKQKAYVVGGFVRDMLLGRKNYDLDIVVEGNGIDFGKKVASALGGTPVAYPKFGTCTVVKGSFRIDFASARRESYHKPAALPDVEFASLKDDLARRDFTINAMAASLNRSSFGRIIDFFGGEKDLEGKTVKVLHDASFIDDPTRIFRAVRFEQRFGFKIDGYTENLIKTAIKEGMFGKTTAHRIGNELVLMLKEKEPIKPILRMKELGELRFIHKKIMVDKNTVSAFSNIGKSGKKHPGLWLSYFMALAENLTAAEASAICDKFAFRRVDREKVISCKRNCRKALKALEKKNVKPSRVYRLLSGMSEEEMIYMKALSRTRRARSRIDDFLTKYKAARTRMGGADIKKLGIKPGPVYKKLLLGLLYARLDGKIKTKKDEQEFLKKHVKGRAH